MSYSKNHLILSKADITPRTNSGGHIAAPGYVLILATRNQGIPTEAGLDSHKILQPFDIYMCFYASLFLQRIDH